MLFFMGSSAHLAGVSGLGHGALMGAQTTGLIAALVIIAALQANAIFGKQGPMTTVKGVITSGLILTVVLWAVVDML